METADILSTLMNDFPYALYGSVCVGVVCSFLGVYVVARKVVFLGAVLTQISLLGLAITFLPLFAIPHTVGSLAVTLLAVLVLSRLMAQRKIPRDAVLGIVFISSVALRILVLQKAPLVEASEVDSLLRGDILFVTPALFYLMLAVGVPALALLILLFKEFNYLSLDPETARTQGFNVAAWEAAFFTISATVISIATHMVGDVFVFGFLVIPASAALMVGRRVLHVFILSVLIGAVSPVIGLFIAFQYDFPSSPAIVAVAGVALVGTWVFSNIRAR